MISAAIDYREKYEEAIRELAAVKLQAEQAQKIADDFKYQYEQLLVQIASVQMEIAQLKKMIFGSRQERFVTETNPSQLALDIKAEAAAPPRPLTQKIEYNRTISQTASVISHPGRMKLPEHLRREERIIEPVEDVSGCKKIGEEITEQLEYEPGELYVKKYVRPKYAKPEAQGVVIGELPAQPIDKGIAGPGLLAQIISDKYVDHLPLHRQMQRFERSGVKLPISTITDWVSATINLITPVYEAHKQRVLATHYLHADELRSTLCRY